MTLKKCCGCGCKTSAIHPLLNIPVCLGCRASKEQFSLVTKTRAASEFKIKQDVLNSLPHIEKRNPHYGRAETMKLYLLSTIKSISNV